MPWKQQIFLLRIKKTPLVTKKFYGENISDSAFPNFIIPLINDSNPINRQS